MEEPQELAKHYFALRYCKNCGGNTFWEMHEHRTELEFWACMRCQNNVIFPPKIEPPKEKFKMIAWPDFIIGFGLGVAVMFMFIVMLWGPYE